MRVYLCGGFKTAWDDRAQQLLVGWDCIKPKDTGLKDPAQFTPTDIGLIESSQAVLCYVERANPGRNWAFELGWAAARGKYIVVAVEPGFYRSVPERYIGMPLHMANEVHNDLTRACDSLVGHVRRFMMGW